MDFIPPTPVRAWQPFTLGGVAAFASSSLFRLVQVQLVFGLVAAGCAVWGFDRTWGSAWSEAIPKLPAAAEIRGGVLTWPGEKLARLAENRFLSIVVDLNATGELASGSDVQVQIGTRELRFRSLFGYFPIHYRADWIVPLDPTEMAAWWGAWEQAVLAGLGASILVGLGFAWGLLALPYAIVIRLIALIRDRPLTMPGAWAMAAAAQLPGILIASVAWVAYCMGRLEFLRLLWVFLLQFPISWFFVVFAPFKLPPSLPLPPSRGGSQNPFANGPKYKQGRI